MDPGSISGIVSGGIGAVVGLVNLVRRRRARAQTQALVWDEILGHAAAPGVPFKPSLSARVQTTETKIAEHAEADLQMSRDLHEAIAGVAEAVGHPEAVGAWRPPSNGRR